jgi:hypothetical protein
LYGENCYLRIFKSNFGLRVLRTFFDLGLELDAGSIIEKVRIEQNRMEENGMLQKSMKNWFVLEEQQPLVGAALGVVLL